MARPVGSTNRPLVSQQDLLLDTPLTPFALLAATSEQIILAREALTQLEELYSRLDKMQQGTPHIEYHYSWFRPVTVNTALRLNIVV